MQVISAKVGNDRISRVLLKLLVFRICDRERVPGCVEPVANPLRFCLSSSLWLPCSQPAVRASVPMPSLRGCAQYGGRAHIVSPLRERRNADKEESPCAQRRELDGLFPLCNLRRSRLLINISFDMLAGAVELPDLSCLVFRHVCNSMKLCL
jgi:hypothetical protein